MQQQQQPQSPGGRSWRGSQSATASKSTGRLSSCLTGSAMAASPRQVLHQGPPPTSTAPLAPSLEQSTTGAGPGLPPGPSSHTRMRTCKGFRAGKGAKRAGKGLLRSGPCNQSCASPAVARLRVNHAKSMSKSKPACPRAHLPPK